MYIFSHIKQDNALIISVIIFPVKKLALYEVFKELVK
jgi:hypothetical protein